MPATFDEIGRNLIRGQTVNMNTEEDISLHRKITDEIERNYRTIDLVGKHYASIFAGVISLFGAIGLGILNVNNFFSDWIFASCIFFSVLFIYTFIGSCISSKGFYLKEDSVEKISEKQEVICIYLILDSAIMYLDSIFRGLGVILITNLIIIMLFSIDLATGNYAILQNEISLIFFSVPAWIWFFLQAISFLVITWVVNSKDSVIHISVRKSLSRFNQKYELEEFTDKNSSLFVKFPFAISIIFFIISIIVPVYEFWNSIANWPFIIAIIIIQFVIFELLNHFFSADYIIKMCLFKIFQLNTALTMVEEKITAKDSELFIKADEIYHNTRIFIPLKVDKYIFLSNYIFFPNPAYVLNEKQQDILMNYLKTVF